MTELISVFPGDLWTLVGGLMIQIHAVHAGLPINRATIDIDMVLHIETGATTFGQARCALESMGYQLSIPTGRHAPVHRFLRGTQQIDVMIADHLAPKHRPTVAGREVFRIPAGTSALRKTVNCEIEVSDGHTLAVSVPNVLGALVLKGAAYLEDSRDRDRHLDDAALLACAISNPRAYAKEMSGSDFRRMKTLATQLNNPLHRSWLAIPSEFRLRARDALLATVQTPQIQPPIRRLGEK
ncbi:hypothetical protein [Nocardia arthritidis]|uniref:Nucleotidyl transferase AbiEii/AbiGii toxin family protein n=1 Tax=Nocardia arthritidis TaxID=228602 RepID=A0A6G9Y953_9NOCA|nr:hypothetical protein [Nocardia arthritidis]QIS09752.1 hypothetical protein F5544_09260 [Nocardia arthritidis]